MANRISQMQEIRSRRGDVFTNSRFASSFPSKEKEGVLKLWYQKGADTNQEQATMDRGAGVAHLRKLRE